MTPKELVKLATSRARSIISNDLERLEFIYEHPRVNVSEVLVDDFVEYSFKNLVALINTYRKGHKGESNRKITHGDDRFYLVTEGSRHFFYMNDYLGVRINWIPYDCFFFLCKADSEHVFPDRGKSENSVTALQIKTVRLSHHPPH